MSKKEMRPNSIFQIAFKKHKEFSTLNVAERWKKISAGKIKARYISPFAIILHQNGLYPKIGKGTWIGHFTIIDGSQGLEIGETCNISSGVHIYTHSTHERCLYGEPKLTASVKIGNHVFVGPNSIITMGCNIGDHAMIAPLSYLRPHTNIPEHSSYGGQPATKKGTTKPKQ